MPACTNFKLWLISVTTASVYVTREIFKRGQTRLQLCGQHMTKVHLKLLKHSFRPSISSFSALHSQNLMLLLVIDLRALRSLRLSWRSLRIGFISLSNLAISVRAAYPSYFPISVANTDELLAAPPDGRLCSDAIFRSLTTTIDFSSRRCSKSWASLLFTAICYRIDNMSIYLSFHECC